MSSNLDPLVYVALGDSTGAGVGAVHGGYVARLHQRILVEHPAAQLVNLCVSGATTADVLRGQLVNGVAKNLQLVTLGIGINDISHGIPTTRELHAHPEYFSPDGFHPSDEGYEMWAVQMWPVIARVLQTI